MTHANRGTKRLCPACGTKYYDLERSPITCPKCQAEYQAQTRVPVTRASRSVRQAQPVLPEVEEEPGVFEEDEVLAHDDDDDEEGLGDGIEQGGDEEDEMRD